MELPTRSDGPTTTATTSTPAPKGPCLPLYLAGLAVLVFIFISITAGIIIFTTSTSSSVLCTSPGCIAAGQRLAASLNTSVNPCEDFAAYACGGWLTSHPIPADKSERTTFEMVADQTIEKLKAIFEHQENLKSSSASSSSLSKAKSVSLVLDLYRECMDMPARDRRGVEPLKKLLKEVLGNSEWPAVNGLSLEGSKSFKLPNEQDGLKTLAQLAEIKVSPLVHFTVEKDANQSHSKIVIFSAPTFGLSRKEFANVDGRFKAEMGLYRQQTMEFGNYFASLPTLPLSLSNLSKTALNESVNQLLKSRLEEVFAFERSLALASRPEGGDRNAAVWYNKMTLEEFGRQTGNFINYTAYLNILGEQYKLPFQFNTSTKVIVKDVGYYRELSKIIVKTPLTTLYNYLGYKLTWEWIYYTDSRDRLFRFKFNSQRLGIEKIVPLWKDCLLEVDNGWAAGRLFVDRHVLPETKNGATEMGKDLRKIFVEKILQGTDVDFLDSSTRNKALEKATAMHFSVAYPDWLLNDTALDLIKYHFTEQDYVKVESGRYFEGVLQSRRREVAIPLQELAEPPSLERDFVLSPAVVNAEATLERNKVEIPAAILQPPFFEPSLPFYLNYGAIGMIISHEITHHFDDEGAQYDLNGNLVNWWSAETRNRFGAGQKCFVEQYESIVDQQTGVRLNGSRTLGENIADSGVRLAYLAVEARLKRDDKDVPQKLPKVEQFSPKQLFFLSFAQNWCEQYRVKEKKALLNQDAHMPGEYRINVPLSNLEQFSQVFSCPAGSKMNPAKKCRLW